MHGSSLILERQWTEPIGADRVLEAAREMEGCFALHRVVWHGSYLATGGTRMVCHFSAPDAESVRIALRQAGADLSVAWAGTVHDAPQAGESNVLVERSFAEPVELDDIQSVEDAGEWCLRAHGVTFIRTFFARDHRRMLCLYQAPDAESVRLAQRQAGMPVDDVWACQFVPLDAAAPG